MNDGSLLTISCDGESSWAIGSGAGTGDNIKSTVETQKLTTNVDYIFLNFMLLFH